MKRELALAVVAFLALVTAVDAASKSKSKPQTIKARGMTMSVGDPITRDNLTVFPVYAPRKVSSEYLTLDEALKEQLIEVKEMGSAEVNRVTVTNKASKPVYLMAGDIILGGQQDREVARDTIVPKTAKEFAVEVFCVEHGRWDGAKHFEGNEVASNSLRYETQRTKQQAKVWARVAQEARQSAAETSTGTYRAIAGNPQAKKDLDGYVKSIGAKLAQDKRAVGIIVAVNGKVISGDVFADRKLFEKQMMKTLKSYALDATQEKDAWSKLVKKPNVSKRDATVLLQDSQRGQSKTAARSVSTVNAERESADAVVYETAPATKGGAAAAPAHSNFFKKK